MGVGREGLSVIIRPCEILPHMWQKAKEKLNLEHGTVHERISPRGASTRDYRVPFLCSNRCPTEKFQALNLTVVSCVNEDS